jgi:flagellar hook-basal body complex protein FliE
MSINIANAVNAYKQALTKIDKGGLDPRTDATGSGDFAGLVRDAATSVTEAVRGGEKATVQAMTGGAELTDIVTAVSNAEITLQTVVVVRDRVIQAYQEIIRMPI